MALSRRFASITPVAVLGSQDDDDAYDDEILKRLLKKQTNFSKIKPSALGISCRDDLGMGGIGKDDDEDELDEDWADDFKSLLKSCESKKADLDSNDTKKNVVDKVVIKEYTEKDLTNRNIKENELYVQNTEDKVFPLSGQTGQCTNKCYSEKKSAHVIQDRAAASKDTCCTSLDRETDSDITINEIKEGSQLKMESSACVKIHHQNEKSHGKVKVISDTVAEKDSHPEKGKSSAICDNKDDQKTKTHTLETSERKCASKSDSALKSKTSQKHSKNKHNKNYLKSTESDRKPKTYNSCKHDEYDKAQEISKEFENKKNEKNVSENPVSEKLKLIKSHTDTAARMMQNNERTIIHEGLDDQRKEGSASASDSKPVVLSKSRSGESKRSKPLIIKEATSFPLDELLPTAAPLKKQRKSLDSNISSHQEIASSARKRHKSEMISCHQMTIKKQKIDVEPRLNDEVHLSQNQMRNISYIPEDVASVLAALDKNQSLLAFFREQLHNETGVKLLSGNSYSDSVIKPIGFYTERNEDRQSSEDENLDSNKSSEELFHLLVQQCSELVKTDEDKAKLQSVVNLLKAESGSDFAGTGFTPELDSCAKTPPQPSPDRKSPPSPYSPKNKLNAQQTFEGRTLLKGGVEPRHIPKTFLGKLGKSRPTDPRTCSNSVQIMVLPLPKFAEEFWKKEKVKQLRKTNLTIKDDLNSKGSKLDKIVKTPKVAYETTETLDSQLATVEQFKCNSYVSQTSRELDENQNILTVDKTETVTGRCALKGTYMYDPGFYAAVASAFSGDEVIQSNGKIPDIKIKTGFEIKNATPIPVLITGEEIRNHKPEERNITLMTKQNTTASEHDQSVNQRNLVCIETNRNLLPSSGSVGLAGKTGACVGIVKPMPVQNEYKIDPVETEFGQYEDTGMKQDTKEVSETEEGEINDKPVEKHPVNHGCIEVGKISKRSNGEKRETRIFERIRRNESHVTDDDSSSCSSVSSRGRTHKRPLRGRHYNRQSRSRYSSTSSVESRSSEISHSNRKKYESERGRTKHFHRPSHDKKYFPRENRERWDHKSKMSESRSHSGKSADSRKSSFEVKHREHYTRGISESDHVERRKVVVDDKREIQKRPSNSETRVTESRAVRQQSIEITDSEDEKFSQDYRAKFGKKSSPHESCDSYSTSVCSSKPLPDSYKADRDFLNYSLKKMKMADRVKHDYVAEPVLGKSQNKQDTESNENTHAKSDLDLDKVSMQMKSAHDQIGVNPQTKRPQTGGVFKYSDMIGLADLEQSESFTFKKKK